MMFCEKCGQKVSQDAKFCKACGAPVQESSKKGISGAEGKKITSAGEPKEKQATMSPTEQSRKPDSLPLPLPVASQGNHSKRNAFIAVGLVVTVIVACGCLTGVATIIAGQQFEKEMAAQKAATDAKSKHKSNEANFRNSYNAWGLYNPMSSGNLSDIVKQKESIRVARNDATSAGNAQSVMDLCNQDSALNDQEDAIFAEWVRNFETQSNNINSMQAKVVPLNKKEKSIAQDIAKKARESNTLGTQLVDIYKQGNLINRRLVELYLSAANKQITIGNFNTAMEEINSDLDKNSKEREAKKKEYEAKTKEAQDLYAQLLVLFNSD